MKFVRVNKVHLLTRIYQPPKTLKNPKKQFENFYLWFQRNFFKMKNLKLYSELSLNLELQSNQEVVLFSALDIERNRFFFASSANFIYSTHLSSFKVWPFSLFISCMCFYCKFWIFLMKYYLGLCWLMLWSFYF